MTENQLNYLYKNFSLIYTTDKKLFFSFCYSNAIDTSYDINIIEGNQSIKVEETHWAEWNGQKIPFLYNNLSTKEVISYSDTVTINFDILKASFYLLSGQQEIETKNKDKYGRFQFEDSIQYKLKFTEIPLVNYYFDILKTAIEKAFNIIIPFKNKFTTCLTHDIDEVNSAWKHRIRLAIENKKPFKGLSFYIKHLFKPFYPWRNIEQILAYEKSINVTSTFFFLTNDNKVDQIKNADYSLDEKHIKKMFHLITKGNNEIALHGSYKTHDNLSDFNNDINALKRTTKGNRFHFLMWDMNKTPSIIEKANLKYDSTLGFQEHIGFRNGICTPFYLYDFTNNRPYCFIEIPLTIMDCSLAFKEYMNLSPDEALKKVEFIITETKKFEGVLTVNWHNTFFSDYIYSDWKKLYLEIIKFCKISNSQFSTCDKIH
jgi:hypothetical protein